MVNKYIPRKDWEDRCRCIWRCVYKVALRFHAGSVMDGVVIPGTTMGSTPLGLELPFQWLHNTIPSSTGSHPQPAYVVTSGAVV